jgi:hypothetical protein
MVIHHWVSSARKLIFHRVGLIAALLVLLLIISANSSQVGRASTTDPQSPNQAYQTYLPVLVNGSAQPTAEYVLIGWNDLGMHCYNHDFQDLAVLPPYNTLWAQVILRGDPPQIVTQGVRVQYAFPDNTTSADKSNFWVYAAQLFGVTLPENVGLKGKGMAGVMDMHSDYFVAEGIPLTEFSDSNPTVPYPYQLAELTAFDIASGAVLNTLTVVAPVSTEMHCDTCHASGGEPGGPYDRVELNILAKHDDEEGTSLMTERPVLCARCHSSNALGLPGVPGLPSLANAMHDQHNEVVPDSMDGCYGCHPGPVTKCLRDVMSESVPSPLDPTRNMDCIDCHGGMEVIKENPNPWLNEPRCDTCHTPTDTMQFDQDQPLYRFSKGHGGVYCEGCHDSTHAIALSRESNDAIKFIQLQGHSGTLNECMVCHLTQPTGSGPHVK